VSRHEMRGEKNILHEYHLSVCWLRGWIRDRASIGKSERRRFRGWIGFRFIGLLLLLVVVVREAGWLTTNYWDATRCDMTRPTMFL